MPPERRLRFTGKVINEQVFTCTAAGGSYLTEMGLLSRLSGNPVFEVAAHRALSSLWAKRSKLNLVGSLIDTDSGRWITSHTGIGAGIDSFYETILKSSIVLGEPSLMLLFEDAYKAVQKHTLQQGWNIEVMIAT
jgi:hypothetical protein